MLVSWMDSNTNQTWTELTPEYGICWTGVISNKMLSLFKRPSTIQSVLWKRHIWRRKWSRYSLAETHTHTHQKKHCITVAFLSISYHWLVQTNYVSLMVVMGDYCVTMIFHHHLLISLCRESWTLCVCSWEKATTECLWWDLIPETRWDTWTYHRWVETDFLSSVMKSSIGSLQLWDKRAQAFKTKQLKRLWSDYVNFWRADVEEFSRV